MAVTPRLASQRQDRAMRYGDAVVLSVSAPDKAETPSVIRAVQTKRQRSTMRTC